MVTYLSSKGCLKTSKTLLENSSISSRNKIPLLAILTLPGLAFAPPPIIAILLDVWCGLTNGLLFISLPLSLISPATEWIFVVSSASFYVIGGRIEGIRLAIIVLPLPGLPIIIKLCIPLAATSAARRAAN